MKTKEIIGRLAMVSAVVGAGSGLVACAENEQTPFNSTPQPTTDLGPIGTAVARNEEAINLIGDAIYGTALSRENAPITAENQVAQEATPVVELTPTIEASAVVTETPVVSETVQVNDWEITYFEGATDQLKGWEFKAPEPAKWPEFPNVDNSQANFQAKDGLEYGMAESVYCQQGETCDVPVPARHYRIISGDYQLPFDSCKSSDVGTQGCALMIVNVGEVTASFEDASVDAGFTVFGRYWNGDTLPTAIQGGLSHVASNMMNLNSELNPEQSVNAGANCSVPEGCQSVRLAFAIVSGNEVLMKGITTVSR